MNYDRNRDELAEKCRESEEKMLAAAEKLGTLRRKTAKTFATKVKSEMAFLNMPNVELVPYFEKCEPNSRVRIKWNCSSPQTRVKHLALLQNRIGR